jgi:MoxR-like ATPase
MMKIVMDYPSPEAELDVIRSYAQGTDLHDVEALVPAGLLGGEEVFSFREALNGVVVGAGVMEYVRRITAETRDPVYVQLGASTRAAVAMLKASRALAAGRGMEFVTPDEVKDVTAPVLRHRVILRPEALIDGLTPDYFLENLLARVPVPR